MQKKHGPDFKRAVIQVETCKVCRGAAVSQGISYELPCEGCSGVGWVASGGAEAPIEDIARALGIRAAKAERSLGERAQIGRLAGGRDNKWNNGKGPGGSHFTGD